jgi:hypothetical protein
VQKSRIRVGHVFKIAAALACLAVSGLLLHFVFRPNPERAEREQYEVYSAYIEAGLTGDSHSFGSKSDLVVILDTARTGPDELDLSRFRVLIGYPFSMRHYLPQLSVAMLYNFAVSNFRAHDLERRFKLSARYELIAWADLKDGVPHDQRFAGNYGYLSFSAIAFNRNFTEALFHADHLCGLCGGGEDVWMRKVNGVWIAEARHSTWVS